MTNDYFQFKQFTIRQDKCAMKVGTDGTILGAWAQAPEGKCRILDIGTGTGLIALMMAQRFPMASVVGVDIDSGAICQACENVSNSPFKNRISIIHEDISKFEVDEGFDAIVSNPPFFVDSLTCPDVQRTKARHTTSLTYNQLMHSASKLLKDNGRMSIIIPVDYQKYLESEAYLEGFFVSRVCNIHTTPRKKPKRCLIEFTKTPVIQKDISDEVLEEVHSKKSKWYSQLTADFYL